MATSVQRWLTWSAWGVSVVAVVGAAGLLAWANGGVSWVLIPGVPAVCFCGAGLVLRLRVPQNRIGWLFVIGGSVLAVGLLFDACGYAAPKAGVSGQVAAAVVANQLELIAFYVLPALLLVFPDGRLPSQRWRPLAVVWMIGVIMVALGTIIRPGGMISLAHDSLDNPLAASGGLGAFVHSAVGAGSFVLVICGVLVAAGSQVWRYRRASGDLRQQLKWFGSAAALFALVFLGLGVLKHVAGPNVTWQALTLALPAALTCVIGATGIAILRYRLYQIDVIIRRTLVYTALIGGLAFVYLGGIYVIDWTLQAVTGQSGALAVTVSTLAVGAGFQPLRTRIQRAVDHRFYRQKYDAAKTIDGFATRLRSQIVLDTLKADVLEVVAATLQPSHASLWLRPSEPSSSAQQRSRPGNA